MIDWAARIDFLADHLAREYTIADRQAVEILLSGLINCPRTPGCWLILETNWYSRDCMDGWFAFGGHWLPCSLARLRARSPWRDIESETKEWLDNASEERLFIECDYERYPKFHRLSQAQYLLQRALRVRTRSTRAADPLRSLDRREQERRADELAAAASYVLEDRAGARPTDPPVFRQPANFLYHLELLQRSGPWYVDWRELLRAFGALGVRHAFLDGRSEVNEEDWAILARVAADSVPPWAVKAIQTLANGPAKSATLEKVMGLEDQPRRSGYGARRELLRLRRNGLIDWSSLKMHWTLADRHRQGILDVISGRAFGTERAALAS